MKKDSSKMKADALKLLRAAGLVKPASPLTETPTGHLWAEDAPDADEDVLWDDEIAPEPEAPAARPALRAALAARGGRLAPTPFGKKV